MNVINEKSSGSCKTNIRFLLQLVLISTLLANPLQTWSSEEDRSESNSNNTRYEISDDSQQSETIQTGNSSAMNKFLGPNAAEPTGPYNRSYQENDPYEQFISSANHLELQCEYMILNSQYSFLTNLEKLTIYMGNYYEAKSEQETYITNFKKLDEKVKLQVFPINRKIDTICSQGFSLKNSLLNQVQNEMTESEFNKIKIVTSSADIVRKGLNNFEKLGIADEILRGFISSIPFGKILLNQTLQFEKDCQVINSTPKPFLQFNPITIDQLQSNKVQKYNDIYSDGLKQMDKDEFSFKNSLNEHVDLLTKSLEQIDKTERRREVVVLKKEILQAIDRAKKTCEYVPKEKRLQTKKNAATIPQKALLLSTPVTAAQEKQLLDDAIHFILNPATDWYSNEVTSVERINNEMKAAQYLIQKKEQYSSTILQLSQNPTNNNKNNSASNYKASASNYKTKNQAVKKVAESKKSKEEKIKAYQKWVDYLDYLIQQSQATWKTRCDKGFNEELCQQYPWSPGVP